jgi:hypothetical protein
MWVIRSVLSAFREGLLMRIRSEIAHESRAKDRVIA